MTTLSDAELIRRARSWYANDAITGDVQLYLDLADRLTVLLARIEELERALERISDPWHLSRTEIIAIARTALGLVIPCVERKP